MSGRTWVFSYGSNSSVQLRARLKNPNLTCIPAYVEDFSRIFCKASRGWSTTDIPSGVASLTPHKGASTFGCGVEMTDEEISLLDAFEGYNAAEPHEGAYRRIPLTINLKQESEEYAQVEGIAYLANDNMWRYPPSEQYLTAIHVMLREQWHCDPVITVRGILDPDSDVPRELYDWKHPGNHSLTLPSLCVEVNVLRESPWVMPGTSKDIVSKLAKVGVHSAAHLAVYLASEEKCVELNEKLKSNDLLTFSSDTMKYFKNVLGV